MITLNKDPNRDFIILNLPDPQLRVRSWGEGEKKREILIRTVTELVERVKPDLITNSGDLAWAEEQQAYDYLADLMDSFRIPWAPIWGNHDNQGGPEVVDSVAERYLTHPYCIYEKEDPAFGNGNYVISIEENGLPVEGVIMLDSHDRYVHSDGTSGWAKLYPEQIEWYRSQVAELKNRGCHDTTMILHIPIYAYRNAFAEAFAGQWSRESATIEMFRDGICWTENYKDTVGVQLEDVASCFVDDGAMDVILEQGSTKTVIAGHDHINNWMINYKGIRLIYALKTGAGCYWNPQLNGGTVLRVTSSGVAEVHHEYVDVSDLL